MQSSFNSLKLKCTYKNDQHQIINYRRLLWLSTVPYCFRCTYTSARVYYVINANKRHTTKLHLPASHELIPVDVPTRFSVSVQNTRRIQWSLVAGRQKWSRDCVDQGRHWMSMCRQLPAVLQSVSYGHCFYTASKTALSLYSLHCDNKTVTDLTGCFK